MACSSCKSSIFTKSNLNDIKNILDPTLKLTESEKDFYIQLFNLNATLIPIEVISRSKNTNNNNNNNKLSKSPKTKNKAFERVVYRNNFPKLTGMIGEDIAKEFAFSIFEACTEKNSKFITLNQYLKYIDIYHHGNQEQRCLLTFKLMDRSKDEKVQFKEFKNYLNLILSAIEKVSPSADNLLSDYEIKELFNKISCNKEYFTKNDFEEVFFNKPELISWIDYFKNNDEELIDFLNSNVKGLLLLMFKFFYNISSIISNFKELNEYDNNKKPAPFELNTNTTNNINTKLKINNSNIFNRITQEIIIFNKKLERRLKNMSNTNNFSNLRSVFDAFNNKNNCKNENLKDFISNLMNDFYEVKDEMTDICLVQKNSKF